MLAVPKTAGMWKTEAFFDQLYRWTCDRAFCRTVPAKWTEDKTTTEIDQKILEQKQCAATGKVHIWLKLKIVENTLKRMICWYQ